MPPRLLNTTDLKQEAKWLEIQLPMVYSYLRPQMHPLAWAHLTQGRVTCAWTPRTGFEMLCMAMTNKNFGCCKPEAGHGIMWNNGTERDRDHIPEGDGVKQNKGREGPDPNSDPTHRLGHGLGCLAAVPRQKPQCDESVSLDIEGIKSPLWRQSIFIQGMAVRTGHGWGAGNGVWSMRWGKATVNPQSRHWARNAQEEANYLRQRVCLGEASWDQLRNGWWWYQSEILQTSL